MRAFALIDRARSSAQTKVDNSNQVRSVSMTIATDASDLTTLLLLRQILNGGCDLKASDLVIALGANYAERLATLKERHGDFIQGFFGGHHVVDRAKLLCLIADLV